MIHLILLLIAIMLYLYFWYFVLKFAYLILKGIFE